MMIRIWNGTEWVDKFDAPANEAEQILQALRGGGLKAILVKEWFPKRPSNLEENIMEALYARPEKTE